MRKTAMTFIGLGQLGTPMVHSLLAAGYAVTVWNRTAAKTKALAESGAHPAATPAEATAGATLVLSCLADDAALRSVFNDDLLAALPSGAVHVSMSTVSSTCARDLTHRHEQHGVAYLAAPVLGRPDTVAARKHSYIVAGDNQAKSTAVPVLEAIGAHVYDLGHTPAQANVAKLAFNFLIAAALEAMSESFTLAEKSGIPKETLHEILTTTLFGCPLYENYGRQIIERNYQDPLFKLELGLKDLTLVNDAAAEAGMPMRLAALLQRRYQEAMERNLGGMDWSGIAEEVRTEAGLSAYHN